MTWNVTLKAYTHTLIFEGVGLEKVVESADSIPDLFHYGIGQPNIKYVYSCLQIAVG